LFFALLLAAVTKHAIFKMLASLILHLHWAISPTLLRQHAVLNARFSDYKQHSSDAWNADRLATGLYIAMILDTLNIPGLSYEVLEADDRVGRRVYIHRFSNAEHDYYDVGAMRFPDIMIMGK